MSNDSSKSHHGLTVAWGPVAAVAYTVVVYFGAQLLAGLLLPIAAILAGLQLSEQDNGGIAGQFYFVLLSDAFILLAILLFLRKRKAGMQQLGFSRRPAWLDVGYALIGYASYFALLLTALMVVGGLTGINLDQRQELGFDNLFDTSEKIMAFIALVVLPPLVEETVFRGFVFTGLRSKFTFVKATIITSILFAAPHLLASSQGLLWVAGIDTLILSFILCYLREKTGALWASMTVHAIKNAIAYTLLLSATS